MKRLFNFSDIRFQAQKMSGEQIKDYNEQSTKAVEVFTVIYNLLTNTFLITYLNNFQ